METNPTDKPEQREWFTLNRALLVGIMALQIIILIALYRNSIFQRADQGRRLGGLGRTAMEPTGYLAAVPVAAAVHRSLAIRDPFLDEPEWGIPRHPSMAHTQEMHEQMNRMLHRAYDEFSEKEGLLDTDQGWNTLMTSPTMDMREQGDSYVLDFSLPGMDASEIEVALEGRLLTIYTSVDEHAPTHRSLSRFERKVLLPGPVEAADSARAMVTNGVLKVIIPKAKEAKPDATRGRIPSGSTPPGDSTH